MPPSKTCRFALPAVFLLFLAAACPAQTGLGLQNCPDTTRLVADLSPNDTNLWRAAYWFDALYGRHDLCEGPADLSLAIQTDCPDGVSGISYLLFLDLDGDDTLETVVSSKNPPAANTVYYKNIANPNYSGGEARQFDQRPVPVEQRYRFALETAVQNGVLTAAPRWNTQAAPGVYAVPELPHGRHKIRWSVKDPCGQERVCEYAFEIKDKKAPEPICLDTIQVNLTAFRIVDLYATAALSAASDNCTPGDSLRFGIQRADLGGSFPTTNNGAPLTFVQFTCDDRWGRFSVEVWAMDKAGNAGFCNTLVKVMDPKDECLEAPAAVISGKVRTASGAGLHDAVLDLEPSWANNYYYQQLITNVDGNYSFSTLILFQIDYTISVYKDNDPLNGVSTLDLVLINKHILGLEPFDSPYKIIAADVNNSRSLTTFDIVELRKLILGIYTELPKNYSWRFVDQKYLFPNPANPFQEVWPEVIQVKSLLQDVKNQDFIAIKIGDVNNSAITHAQAPAEARTAGTLWFEVSPEAGPYLDIGHSVLDIGYSDNVQYPTRNVQCPGFAHDPDKSRDFVHTGDEVSLVFRAAAPVAACQFTLEFPALELLDLMPGPGLTPDHFAVFPAEHALTASLDNEAVPPAFTVRFRAQADGRLSQLLAFSDRITRRSAVRLNGAAGPENLDLALRFAGQDAATGFLLYPNTPNPWTDQTRIGFYLPAPAGLTLRVYDATGRPVWAQQGSFEAGMQQMTVVGADLGAPGVYYYALETPWGQALGRMCRL